MCVRKNEEEKKTNILARENFVKNKQNDQLYIEKKSERQMKRVFCCVLRTRMKCFSKETSYIRKGWIAIKKTESQQGGSNELEFAIALDITITRSHTRGERKTNTNFLDKKMKNGWAFFRP